MTTINQYAFDAITGYDGSATPDDWDNMSHSQLVEQAEAQAEYFESVDTETEKLDAEAVADAIVAFRDGYEIDIHQARQSLDLEEQFLSSSESRDTSDEIMRAIWIVAGRDYRKADRLWDEGPQSSGQLVAIIEIATGNGRDGEPEDYCWGAAGTNWAKQD